MLDRRELLKEATLAIFGKWWCWHHKITNKLEDPLEKLYHSEISIKTLELKLCRFSLFERAMLHLGSRMNERHVNLIYGNWDNIWKRIFIKSGCVVDGEYSLKLLLTKLGADYNQDEKLFVKLFYHPKRRVAQFFTLDVGKIDKIIKIDLTNRIRK